MNEEAKWCIFIPFNAYYSAIKSNEILIYATAGMILESIMLNKRKQTQRPHNVWFHLYNISGKGKSTESESSLVVVSAGRSREWEMTIQGVWVFLLEW